MHIGHETLAYGNFEAADVGTYLSGDDWEDNPAAQKVRSLAYEIGDGLYQSQQRGAENTFIFMKRLMPAKVPLTFILEYCPPEGFSSWTAAMAEMFADKRTEEERRGDGYGGPRTRAQQVEFNLGNGARSRGVIEKVGLTTTGKTFRGTDAVITAMLAGITEVDVEWIVTGFNSDREPKEDIWCAPDDR